MIPKSAKRLLSRSLVVTVTAMVVLSMAFAGVSFATTESPTNKPASSASLSLATPTENNTSYYDDFEDQNYDGWTPDSESAVEISNKSFYGNYSFHAFEDGTSANGATWTDGPTFDTGDAFEVSGTYKAVGGASSASSSLGVRNDSTGKRAKIIHDWGAGTTYLSTDTGATDGIDGAFNDTWVTFRMQFDDGDAKLKIWEAGTDQPESWQYETEFDEFSGEFVVTPGNGGTNREIYVDTLDAGQNALSGQVVDQHGNPVSNATVEAMGVDYDSLNDTIENKNETAKELLSEAENPLPDAWNNSTKLTGEGSVFGDAESTVVAVHTTDDWQLSGHQLPGTKHEVRSNPELGDPMLIAPNDEELILSLWDPTQTGGLINFQDAVEEDLPGTTTTGTVVIEQISPSGDVVDRTKRETKPYVEMGVSFASNTHEAIAINPPNNHFYRVYPEGNEAAAYVFARGDPEEIGYALSRELENEAGQITDRARELQSNIEDGTFRRVTTTTNETGHYQIRTLNGVQTASVQAYKADGDILTDITAPSIEDLRTAHERGYNGSVYVSPTPTRADIPSQNNTIQVYKSPTPPFGDMDSYANITDWLQNELLNESSAMLESMFEDELENIGLEDLKDRHEELQRLVENNEELRNRLDELLEGDLSDGDASREELIEELEAMDQAVADLEERLATEPPDTSIDAGEIHGTFPFGGDLNSDAISVIAHYQDGSSEVVGDDYWRVESSSLLGGDQVVVDGYPLPEDTAVADIEVTGVSQDGRLGSSRGSVVNPAFDGNVPDVEAIDVSHLRPGVDEPVSLTVRSDDTSFGGVSDVTVYGPDGTELSTTTDGSETAFAPEQAGVHSVRVTYENQGGTPFAETFRLQAKEQPTSDPPTVRIIEGLGGPTAIAGDQLESAGVSVDGDTASILAQAPGDESPSNLDVRAEALTVDTIDLAVVSGSNQEAINNHASVRLHTDFGIEETLVYRGTPASPITENAATKFGAWESRESSEGDTHRVVETYTDANGEVTIDTSRNPGLIERFVYRVTVTSPIDLPLEGLVSTAVAPFNVLSGLIPTDLPNMLSMTLTTTGPIVAEPATTATAPSAPGPLAAGIQGVTA